MFTFSSLLVTGRDRARFLHNFCTNDVRGLPAGRLIEAFFTDVKARILAHGYVLAFETHHEILLPAADAEPLRKHLDRYIITEDVSVKLSPGLETRIFACDPPAPALTALADGVIEQTGACRSLETASGALTILTFSWNQRRLCAICGPETALQEVKAQSFPGLLTEPELQLLRIQERLPIVGIDLTNEHLAPEADRNATAICFTKGCYLGQEPIARIDALGHINKALRCVVIAADDTVILADNTVILADDTVILADNTVALPADTPIRNPEGTTVGLLTSAARNDHQSIVGLAVIRLAAANQPGLVVDHQGVPLPVSSVNA